MTDDHPGGVATMTDDDPQPDRDATHSPPQHSMTDDNTDRPEQVTNGGAGKLLTDGGDSGANEAESSDGPRAPADSDEGGPRADSEEPADDGDGMSELRRRLNYALLAGLSLLALVAALQFYLNASSTINQWVTREYRSIFQATFNLVVLLVTAAGISRQVRRLTG